MVGKDERSIYFVSVEDVMHLWTGISIVLDDVRGFISGVVRISIPPCDVMWLFCFIESRLS